jgi:hypothetical protein
MKHNRFSLIVFSVLAVLALTLSACGPKDIGPVTLTVTGLVDKPLSLTDAGLHKMDVVNISVEHPKNGMTDYSGVYLSDLLAEAGVQAGATSLVLTASDGYSAEVDLAEVTACTDCLVSFNETVGDYMAVMPGQSSKAWVKGLISIEIK